MLLVCDVQIDRLLTLKRNTKVKKCNIKCVAAPPQEQSRPGRCCWMGKVKRSPTCQHEIERHRSTQSSHKSQSWSTLSKYAVLSPRGSPDKGSGSRSSGLVGSGKSKLS